MRFGLILLAALATVSVSADAASPPSSTHWVMLGTQGGPMPSAQRSQPANILLTPNGAYLIDAGDGAVEQLAKAGIPLAQVKAVVFSHLHFDHTAGLFGLLGLRYQTSIFAPLTIYGPPGTRQLVDGILAAMEPTAHSGYGMPGSAYHAPAEGIEVIEIRDSASFALGSTKVTARKNTHYSFVPGSADDEAYESLSLRFDAPDRSIVYTGDTGPSPAVAELARGADLLVSEMIDIDGTLADIRRASPNMPAAAMALLETHLRTHHLTPEELGDLASAAEVKAVVITHLSAPDLTGARELDYLARLRSRFAGPAIVGRDLEEF
jgi:ribonuclease BN (tRNA processing enzyme)